MAGSAKNVEANRLVVVTDQAVQDALVEAGEFSSWIGSSAVNCRVLRHPSLNCASSMLAAKRRT